MESTNNKDFTVYYKISSAFTEYCQQTTLHGWQYLSSTESACKKTIWLTIIFFVSGLSTFLTIRNIDEYRRATTVTSIDSTTASLTEIVFPSVYVCNINQVTKSFVSQLYIDDDARLSALLYDQFINGYDNGTQSSEEELILDQLYQKMRDNFGWNESVSFLRISSQKCSDMLIYTEWSQRESRKFFKSFSVLTDYGLCCLIVPHLDFVDSRTKRLDPMTGYRAKDFLSIPTRAKNGPRFGLKMILDLESFDYAYFPRESQGFLVALTDAADQPVINQDGFYLSPGTETLAGLTMTVLETTSKALSRFSPIERDCYDDGEFDLKTLNQSQGYRYSVRNCLYEAVIENILTDCRCRPSYPEIFFDESLPFCRGENLTCAISWMNAMGSDDHQPDLTFAKNSKNEKLKCLQRCQLQTETMLSTTSTYPNKQTFSFRPDLCFLLQKLKNICNDKTKAAIFELHNSPSMKCEEIVSLQICDEHDKANLTKVLSNEHLYSFLFNYARNNMAVLKVFIKDPYYTKISKDEKMSFVSFVGNAGGLAGLCTGFSFVSIFEIVYHCLNYFVNLVWRKIRPNKTSLLPLHTTHNDLP